LSVSTVRQELKQAITALDPAAFEVFVVRVLTELGFEVEHTGRTNDGGVDAEALLSLEGLTSVLTKVQAKRWSHSVSGRIVRELRGALRVDERSLIVTTADLTRRRRFVKPQRKARRKSGYWAATPSSACAPNEGLVSSEGR
jgi:restriction endonuclease Mrr